MKEILKQLQEKYNKLGLSRTELAQELGISLATLDRMLANGDTLPPFTKIGRQYLFLLTDIVRFLEKEDDENINKGKQMTNNTVFSIKKVKYTINKARNRNFIPTEILEIVKASCLTYENMEYSADDNAPESVKDFLAVLQTNLIRAKNILEAQMRSNTDENHGGKNNLSDNFKIIQDDYMQSTIFLKKIEKDMMAYYSDKQPKEYVEGKIK